MRLNLEWGLRSLPGLWKTTFFTYKGILVTRTTDSEDPGMFPDKLETTGPFVGVHKVISVGTPF